MAGISRTGLTAGGLVAGIVLLATGTVFGSLVVLPEAAANFGDAYSPSLAVPLLSRLALGFVIVWVYAGLRPRYGVGSRSVLAAGLAIWVAWAFAIVSTAAIAPIANSLTIALVVVWGLIEIVAAAFAGGSVYRNRAAARVRRKGRSVRLDA